MLAGVLLASPSALALNPDLDVGQYAHMPWKVRDGFVNGAISSLARTPDGYLWIGTEFGLQRFDGDKPLAKVVGGKLALWSKSESGTEVELTIPASIAYGKQPAPGRSVSAQSEKGT